MATSPRQLLEQVNALTGHDATAAPDPKLAHVAVTAIGHLGRALDHLAAPDTDAQASEAARRCLASREVGAACRALARQWPAAAGQLPDLAGAAADLLARHAPRLGPDERWAAAAAVNTVVGSCAELAARFPPYANLPALRRVQRATALLAHLAELAPPDPALLAVLDRPVPQPHASDAVPAPVLLVDAAANLLAVVARASRERILDVRAAGAVCAAAETAAGYAASLATQLDRGQREHRPRRAAEGWRVLGAALGRFDDGSRYLPPSASPVTESVTAVQNEVAALTGRAPGSADELAATATATRFAANQLPALARHVQSAAHAWASAGRLFARARSLPGSELHVTAVLRDRAVMATPFDVGPVLLAAGIARRLSADLALDLDRSAGHVGRQPQPHLITALNRERRPTRAGFDTDWARRIAARAEQLTARHAIAD